MPFSSVPDIHYCHEGNIYGAISFQYVSKACLYITTGNFSHRKSNLFYSSESIFEYFHYCNNNQTAKTLHMWLLLSHMYFDPGSKLNIRNI